MKITAINGSPKANGGVSEIIIRQMEKILGTEVDTYNARRLVKDETPREAFAEMLNADVILIVFPLYVDSLPSPLIELLMQLSTATYDGIGKKPKIYTIINCGFYESEQTRLAIDMIEHFANHAGLAWGYGLGIGCGPMLVAMGENWQKGPAGSVHKALADMANGIKKQADRDNTFIVLRFPRFAYKAAGHMSWRSVAKKNGVMKTIRAKPYSG